MSSAPEPVEEIRDRDVHQVDLCAPNHSMESEASEPLSAEMKVDDENVPKPTSSDDLIEDSDIPVESYTQMDEPIEV